MSCRTIAVRLARVAIVLGATAFLGQSTPGKPSFTLALEFPVFLQQNVVAGKTPVGTRIQAKLAVATLVQGVVIPQDALLSGEVIESAARSATEPSRLAICVDSAGWKKGATPKTLALAPKLYLTAWYYPAPPPEPADFPDDLPQDRSARTRRRGSSVPYPNPNSQDSPPYTRGNTDDTTNPAPPAPSAPLSPHRVLMKNVEATRGHDGRITLTSKRSDIKLDRATTYVLASGELLASQH